MMLSVLRRRRSNKASAVNDVPTSFVTDCGNAENNRDVMITTPRSSTAATAASQSPPFPDCLSKLDATICQRSGICRDSETLVLANDNLSAEATESTIAIAPKATMKPFSQYLFVQGAIKPSDDGLSARERMWYKNQIYLLANAKDHAVQSVKRTPAQLSMKYDSGDRGLDPDDIGSRANSPKGIDEFESESMSLLCKNVKHNASLRSMDTSSCLFDFDSETHHKVDSGTYDASEFSKHSSDGSTTQDGTTTSTSYFYELVDEGNKQGRKYPTGVGQNLNLSYKPRELLMDSATRQTIRRKGISHAASNKPQNRRKKTPIDESSCDSDGEGCPFIIWEELSGTCADVKSAFRQVLDPYFLSPVDIDRILDTLSDAKTELIEMCHDQTANRKRDVVRSLSRYQHKRNYDHRLYES